MYSSIVVPLDGSTLAEQALPYVKELVKNRTAKVHLISVAPVTSAVAPVHMYPPAIGLAEVEVDSQERERIEQELTHYLNGVALDLGQGSVTTRVEVRFGEAAEEIIAYAQDVHADLIAMCTHGRTGLARWAYGSVTEKVARHAHCPILLVRAKPE